MPRKESEANIMADGQELKVLLTGDNLEMFLHEKIHDGRGPWISTPSFIGGSLREGSLSE